MLTNPVTGVSVLETDREGWDVEIRLAPGAGGPAEHVHRTVEERFEVCEGTVTFRVDGRGRALGPGTELGISPGTAHAFGNGAADEAVLLGRTVPESDELGRVVATLSGLASEGRTDGRGRPGFLQGAVIAEDALDETYFAVVPYGVQRAGGCSVPSAGRSATGRRTIGTSRSRSGGRRTATRDRRATSTGRRSERVGSPWPRRVESAVGSRTRDPANVPVTT